MPNRSLDLLLSAPEIRVPAGTLLLQRGVPVPAAVFIESGQVALGVAGLADPASAASAHSDPSLGGQASAGLAHQIGIVQGPAWLETPAILLNLPSASDAVATTSVVLRRVSLEAFQAAVQGTTAVGNHVLLDLARAYREQPEHTLSRFAKDAEARCAEWLLRHADSGPGATCVKLELRKRAIAAQLGIAPETLSRVLRHLRERRLISGSGRVLNLVDPGGLRALADS